MAIEKALPFSQAFGVTEQGKGLIVIPLMLLIGVLAGIHYACTFLNYGIYVYIVVIIIIVIFAWKKALNISWKSLN
jgi:hypothetical protein